MRIIKHLETCLDIIDVNDIFCIDYRQMLLNMLKKKFVGRCYKSVYILDIIDITKRSSIDTCSKSLNGNCFVNVEFKADCIVYEKGEIIHNAKIIEINDAVILAKSEYCSIQIKNITNIDVFKVEQQIPIIVSAVRYSIYDTEISVTSITLIPVFKDIKYYKVIGSTFTENKEDLIEIDELRAKLKAANSRAVKFFVDLLYPYKKRITYKNTSALSIKDFAKVKEGDLVFVGERYLGDDTYYKATETDQDSVEFEIQSQELYDILLSETKKDLYTLLGFLDTYDITAIKNLSILWSIYVSLKK